MTSPFLSTLFVTLYFCPTFLSLTFSLSFVLSLSHSFTLSLIHSFTHSLFHSFTLSLIHSLTHSLSHSLSYSLLSHTLSLSLSHSMYTLPLLLSTLFNSLLSHSLFLSLALLTSFTLAYSLLPSFLHPLSFLILFGFKFVGNKNGSVKWNGEAFPCQNVHWEWHERGGKGEHEPIFISLKGKSINDVTAL